MQFTSSNHSEGFDLRGRPLQFVQCMLAELPAPSNISAGHCRKAFWSGKSGKWEQSWSAKQCCKHWGSEQAHLIPGALQPKQKSKLDVIVQRWPILEQLLCSSDNPIHRPICQPLCSLLITFFGRGLGLQQRKTCIDRERRPHHQSARPYQH